MVILKEEVQAFKNKKIISVTGNSKEDIKKLEGQKIVEFKTWGKHFLVCFKAVTLRVHFLLFGRYSKNEKRNGTPRLSLQFKTENLIYTLVQ